MICSLAFQTAKGPSLVPVAPSHRLGGILPRKGHASSFCSDLCSWLSSPTLSRQAGRVGTCYLKLWRGIPLICDNNAIGSLYTSAWIWIKETIIYLYIYIYIYYLSIYLYIIIHIHTYIYHIYIHMTHIYIYIYVYMYIWYIYIYIIHTTFFLLKMPDPILLTLLDRFEYLRPQNRILCEQLLV